MSEEKKVRVGLVMEDVDSISKRVREKYYQAQYEEMKQDILDRVTKRVAQEIPKDPIAILDRAITPAIIAKIEEDAERGRHSSKIYVDRIVLDYLSIPQPVGRNLNYEVKEEIEEYTRKKMIDICSDSNIQTYIRNFNKNTDENPLFKNIKLQWEIGTDKFLEAPHILADFYALIASEYYKLNSEEYAMEEREYKKMSTTANLVWKIL